MHRNLLPITLVLLSLGATGQSKLLDKLSAVNEPTEITFFADDGLTQPITSISDGTMEFYVKAPILRARAGKALDYTATALEVNWNGSRSVYRDASDLGMKATKFAKEIGFEVFKVDFRDETKTGVFFDYVEDAENEVFDLVVAYTGGRNRNIDFAVGTLTLDLSRGRDRYIEYILSRNADYTFSGTDAFQDDELKARVITDFESRWGITIHQFAWGERVPYTGDDLKYYRRHTAGMTYIEADGTCYKAGVSVFDVSVVADGPFVYGRDGSQFNPERIPCDRVKM